MTSMVIVDAQKPSVVGPARFVTQCVTNREGLIELAHVAKVGRVKAFSELDCQNFRQCRQQQLPIPGPTSSLLLKFDNMPPDLPTGLHLSRIDRSQHRKTCLADQFAKVAHQ
jgi:hypothetical protein